jgi:RNA polymerase sigma factor (sigma-70 family)
MESLNVEALIEQIRSGDNSMLKDVFKLHSGFCLSMLQKQFKCYRQDAEDVYTDSIINFRDKVLQGKLETITSMRSYLFGTCRNMMMMRLRKEKRIQDAALVIFPRGEHDPGESEEDYHDEIRKATYDAMILLPEKCQEILKAFYFDRCSMDEIARKFSLASANVAKVSKSRCFQKLVDQVRGIKTEDHANGKR